MKLGNYPISVCHLSESDQTISYGFYFSIARVEILFGFITASPSDGEGAETLASSFT